MENSVTNIENVTNANIETSQALQNVPLVTDIHIKNKATNKKEGKEEISRFRERTIMEKREGNKTTKK